MVNYSFEAFASGCSSMLGSTANQGNVAQQIFESYYLYLQKLTRSNQHG